MLLCSVHGKPPKQSLKGTKSMSKIKFEKAYAKQRVSSFGGIREGLAKNGNSASDIRNFRLRPDGSLEKRNGWRFWQEIFNPIRGFWEGTVDGEQYCFVVSGNKVYRIQNEEITALDGTLTTSLGNVRFQKYRNRLYLMDRLTIRLFSSKNQSFTPARGYVPLYGHNWHPTQMGDINEPLNVMNQHLRIHYLNTTGAKTFSLPFFASSLDSVRVNNRATTSYTFTEGSDSFTLSYAAAGDVVEIAMTISGTNSLRQQVHSTELSYLHRNGSQEQLFLYGAPQGYRIFPSSEVADISLTYCSLFYSDCDPLYFQQNQILLIGDEDTPVTAITANFDRLLAFTTKGTHSISTDGNKLFSYPVLSDLGCSIDGAAVQIGNDSIVINERGLCRLHSTASDPDDLSVQNLSDRLGVFWTKNLSQGTVLFWDGTKQELWIRNTAEKEVGLVWIWNAALDEWYCFDDIYAIFFSYHNGQILFAMNGHLCLFDETLYTDGDVNFSAYYQSNYMSFDSSHAAKRALRASVAVSTNGADFLLMLTTERNYEIFAFEGKKRAAPEFFDVRLAPGRFRFLCYRITCVGANASKIHEANFFTTL